ncbi:MAG: hypothetical protein ACTS7D_00365 [Candidatus Hodgkinia cicadicola]
MLRTFVGSIARIETNGFVNVLRGGLRGKLNVQGNVSLIADALMRKCWFRFGTSTS